MFPCVGCRESGVQMCMSVCVCMCVWSGVGGHGHAVGGSDAFLFLLWNIEKKV